MEQQARAQQLDLLVLATSEIERQRLNPASRSEIIILFQALTECVVTNPNVEVDDDQDHT